MKRGQSRKSRWSQSSGNLGLHESYSTLKVGPSCPADGDVSWCSHYGDSMEVLKKLQTELSFPAVPLLSIYLDKTYNSKRYIHLVLAALCTVATTWPVSYDVHHQVRKEDNV